MFHYIIEIKSTGVFSQNVIKKLAQPFKFVLVCNCEQPKYTFIICYEI